MNAIVFFIIIMNLIFSIFLKDRFEDLSKESSARVQAYRSFGLIHSYTLECGFHDINPENNY